ncbi:MAG: hypothetical protein WD060_08020 [Pirellulales bacterium]
MLTQLDEPSPHGIMLVSDAFRQTIFRKAAGNLEQIADNATSRSQSRIEHGVPSPA